MNLKLKRGFGRGTSSGMVPQATAPSIGNAYLTGDVYLTGKAYCSAVLLRFVWVTLSGMPCLPLSSKTVRVRIKVRDS